MLIVASDISTEIYYSHISSEFEEAKLSGNQDFDRDSRLQLYAAPLILGYFAVSERNGDTKWTSPQNDVVHYSMASDMVLLVIQLEGNQDELLAVKYLTFMTELIELLCGPLASYSLSKKSSNQIELNEILSAATESFLSNPLPPLMLPERVFLSNQLHKSTLESLQKIWSSSSEYISALVCNSKVVRSYRLRGNFTPSTIKILCQLDIPKPRILYVTTQHGKRMFLAQRIAVYSGIYLLILSPVRSEDSEKTFLSDLYLWEDLLLHLSRHSALIETHLWDIEIITKRLFEMIPSSHRGQIEKIWESRVYPVLKLISSPQLDRHQKRQEFNSKFNSLSILTSYFINQLPRLVILCK